MTTTAPDPTDQVPADVDPDHDYLSDLPLGRYIRTTAALTATRGMSLVDAIVVAITKPDNIIARDVIDGRAESEVSWQARAAAYVVRNRL